MTNSESRLALAFAALMSFTIAGCQTTEHRLARLHTGMTRSEVIDLLGSPKTVAHNGAMEVLDFDLTQRDYRDQWPGGKWYYVILGPDKRVESFGPQR